MLLLGPVCCSLVSLFTFAPYDNETFMKSKTSNCRNSLRTFRYFAGVITIFLYSTGP